MTDIQVRELPLADAAADSSRRDFLKKAAIVAWSAPVIMTVTANRASAFHNGTCHASGEACDNNVTTARKGCCASNTRGGVNTAQVCCSTTTAPTTKTNNPDRRNTCGSAQGALCTTNADCCSNNCNGALICT